MAVAIAAVVVVAVVVAVVDVVVATVAVSVAVVVVVVVRKDHHVRPAQNLRTVWVLRFFWPQNPSERGPANVRIPNRFSKTQCFCVFESHMDGSALLHVMLSCYVSVSVDRWFMMCCMLC